MSTHYIVVGFIIGLIFGVVVTYITTTKFTDENIDKKTLEDFYSIESSMAMIGFERINGIKSYQEEDGELVYLHSYFGTPEGCFYKKDLFAMKIKGKIE